MDKAFLFQDLQMVRGNAIPKAQSIPDFRKRGSWMVSDTLVNQETELPLENLFSDQARMLEGYEGRCREQYDSAHRGRGGPREARRGRPGGSRLQMNGEIRGAPRAHGHRSREGGGIADPNPHIVHVRRQLGESKR